MVASEAFDAYTHKDALSVANGHVLTLQWANPAVAPRQLTALQSAYDAF